MNKILLLTYLSHSICDCAGRNFRKTVDRSNRRLRLVIGKAPKAISHENTFESLRNNTHEDDRDI